MTFLVSCELHVTAYTVLSPRPLELGVPTSYKSRATGCELQVTSYGLRVQVTAYTAAPLQLGVPARAAVEDRVPPFAVDADVGVLEARELRVAERDHVLALDSHVAVIRGDDDRGVEA